MTSLTLTDPARPPTAIAERSGPGLQPGRAIAWLWALALVLSLYSAEELVLSVRASSFLGENRHALALADTLASASRASRLAALHRVLEGEGNAGGQPPAAPAPPPAPPDAPAPAAAGVSRILIVGASSIQFHLGVELERELSRAYVGLQVLRLGKLSTGLTRPDVFNWPVKLGELVRSFQPDLVIANFGGNDAQGMVLADGRVTRFGRPEWEETYRARMEEIVAIGRAARAQVVLLGMSTTRDPVLSRRMSRLNTLTEEAARRAGAHYLSIWDLGADGGGRYQEVATIRGVPTKTRLADGKHFSRAGAAHVAAEIGRRLAVIFQLRPAADIARQN